MNDLDAKPAGMRSLQQGRPKASDRLLLFRWRLVVLGVIYPAIVIAVELGTRICAEHLFDPMPTPWHALAVCFVPAMTLLTLLRFDGASAREARWLMVGTGIATAIAMTYAVLFVPIVPIAVIGIVYGGIGLLPLAPIASAFCTARLLARAAVIGPDLKLARHGLAGAAMGLASLAVFELPIIATRTGIEMAASSDAGRRDTGLSLLRTLGDDDLLLRFCYGEARHPAGPLGMLMLLGDMNGFQRRPREVGVTPAAAREIYYRVHGVAFNAVPAPAASGRQTRRDDFQFDSDQGGAEVGGRVKGLSLTASRLDGSIAADDALAYLEWTFEFQNASALDREARVELALPPGAVVSRASLWIDGEEREAAYGGRGQVRAAYQKVAIQQRRDPLLVTTKGGDRVLAQAFPVPRNGGMIKFKIGMTAPLDLIDQSTGRLVLPAIFDRNFTIPSDFSHGIWIDSKAPVTSSSARISTEAIGVSLHRASGQVDDKTLFRMRPALSVIRQPGAGVRVARIGEGPAIAQDVRTETAGSGATTLIVIDGSAQIAGSVDDIVRALAAATGKVGLIIASEAMVQIPPRDWDKAALATAAAILRTHRFIGGQDNSQALAAALLALEAQPRARLLWVHGPQPQSFAGAAARLAQTVDRISPEHLPALTLYPVAAGPNAVLPDVPWTWSGRMLPKLGALDTDLAGYLRAAAPGTTRRVIDRRPASEADRAASAIKGSDHIVRLWTRDRVLEMMRLAANPRQREEQRVAAVALAAGQNLVTPVSGAVVLETRQQYDENRLTPAPPSTVPTVPEPHEWALICMAGLAVIWLFSRKRAPDRGVHA